MKWYWTVRLYSPSGTYAHAQIETSRNTHEIDLIKDFYESLTGCKMLLEGMSETKPLYIHSPKNAFDILFQGKLP